MAVSQAVPWAAGGREVGKGRGTGRDEMCACGPTVVQCGDQ